METTNDLQAFKHFAKEPINKFLSKSLNAVIYTRVSSKEQAENLSLDTQRKSCELHAKRSGFNILGFFGGTYESAKTDERKEFNKMLNFVRRSKDRIGHIIVYNEDRFSRTGANGIHIADSLKKAGVLVHSAMSPIDTTTPEGTLQQNIKFIFGNYDNELRRSRVIAGMREKMLRGYWPTKAPIGYDQLRINGEQKILVNEKGKLLRKAFEWKAKEGLSNVEIANRLFALKFPITDKMLSKVLRNPFYCGIMVHSVLNGDVVEGKHEKLISKELFLRVNEIQNENHHHYKHEKESEPHPLRRFVRCDECGSSFCGYVVKKKGLHYYKCTKKGCCCNRRADRMHELFLEFLEHYSIDERLIVPFHDQLKETFFKLHEDNLEQERALINLVKEISKKVETLEERYALGAIDREMYDKFIVKYQAELAEKQGELRRISFDFSNLSKVLDTALNIASNIHNIWKLGTYAVKEKLQYLLFPEGIRYDRKNHVFRTGKINSIFNEIAWLSDALKNEKEKGAGCISSSPILVIPEGFEPSTRSLEGCCSIQLSYETII